MVGWMIGLILKIVIGAILIVAVIALIKIIAEFLVRVVLALLLSVSVGFIGAAIAEHWYLDGMLIGVGLWLVSLPLSLILIWKWRGPLSERSEPAQIARPRKTDVPKLRDYDIERELGLVEAEALASAWRSAIDLAPVAGLDRPRTACARFLAAVENSADNDPATLDTIVFVQRHVPGLVDDTQAVLATAGAEERGEEIANLVEELHQLGLDCEADLAELNARARDRLKIRRFRFRQRKNGQEDWA